MVSFKKKSEFLVLMVIEVKSSSIVVNLKLKCGSDIASAPTPKGQLVS